MTFTIHDKELLKATDVMREYSRIELPSRGLVLEDIDLVVRVWTDDDGIGRLALCEFKFRNGAVSDGQWISLCLLDELCGDDPRYMGLWIVRYDILGWPFDPGVDHFTRAHDFRYLSARRYRDPVTITGHESVKRLCGWLDDSDGVPDPPLPEF